MFRTFMCVFLGVMGMAASAQNAEFRMTLSVRCCRERGR